MVKIKGGRAKVREDASPMHSGERRSASKGSRRTPDATRVKAATGKVDGFSGAEHKRFNTRDDAQAWLDGAQVVASSSDSQAQALAAAKHKQPRRSGVLFDRSMLPRGFTLGTVKAAGKFVRSAAALPSFGAFSRVAQDSDQVEMLPQHGQVDGGEGAVQPTPPFNDVATVDDDPASGQDDSDAALADDFTAFDTRDAESAADGVSTAPGPGEAATAVIKTSWEPWELPWHDRNRGIASQSLRLHNEIVELTELLRPTEKEDEQRRAAVGQCGDIVTRLFPKGRLAVFGSFATGLHLPTSDVDCVILDADISDHRVPTALHGLAKAFQREEWVTNLEVITTAKVPIVKLVVMPYGLKFDISIGRSNGVAAANLIRQHLAAWPPLRPLVTILKLFLLQRNMNEVYSGGLGSFALIVSAVAFMQLHQSRKRTERPPEHRRGSEAAQLECNLGLLLIDYFRFLGRQLRYQTIGLSCADGGYCYIKRQQGFGRFPSDKSDRFSLMDPLDEKNDVGRGAFNSGEIRHAFDHAYNMLTTPQTDRSQSLLGSIMRLDEVLAIRPPPSKMRPTNIS